MNHATTNPDLDATRLYVCPLCVAPRGVACRDSKDRPTSAHLARLNRLSHGDRPDTGTEPEPSLMSRMDRLELTKERLAWRSARWTVSPYDESLPATNPAERTPDSVIADDTGPEPDEDDVCLYCDRPHDDCAPWCETVKAVNRR